MHTDYEFVYITCYLPPENSVWGRDSERFFAVLLHIIYSSETENIIIAGDFNSRVGNLSDRIEDVDSIPLRNSIDSHINQHGKNMIEFLQESKFVIINGRGDIGSNDFTCKTSHGSSVVDYFLLPQHCFNHCSGFSVESCNSVVENESLHHLMHNRSRIPDHSVLTLWYKLNSFDLILNSPLNVKNVKKVKKRFNFKNIPNEFLKQEHCKNQIQDLVLAFNSCPESIEYLDSNYATFQQILYEDMEIYLAVGPEKKITKHSHKHFWNTTLDRLWLNMRCHEKILKHCNNTSKNVAWANFIISRNIFDKNFRYFRRQYVKGNMINIEMLNNQNPSDFWQRIKDLGPCKKKTIPFAVLDGNNVVTDKNLVLAKWKYDFENLYRYIHGANFDNNFLETSRCYLRMYEQQLEDPLLIQNELLNKNIQTSEIVKVVEKSKSGKATGNDEIP